MGSPLEDVAVQTWDVAWAVSLLGVPGSACSWLLVHSGRVASCWALWAGGCGAAVYNAHKGSAGVHNGPPLLTRKESGCSTAMLRGLIQRSGSLASPIAVTQGPLLYSARRQHHQGPICLTPKNGQKFSRIHINFGQFGTPPHPYQCQRTLPQ